MKARIALRGEQLFDFLGFEGLGDFDGKRDQQARVAGLLCARQQVVGNRLGRILLHRLGAAAAEQVCGAGVQQLHMVVQLGHGADRGARGAHRIRLVDRDRGRNAVDGVHLRAILAIKELPRVGREGLDVAALALGVQRVEHQRGFAGTGHAGDDDQLVRRQREREVLEIVLARATDDDGVVAVQLLVGHGCGRPFRRRVERSETGPKTRFPGATLQSATAGCSAQTTCKCMRKNGL